MILNCALMWRSVLGWNGVRGMNVLRTTPLSRQLPPRVRGIREIGRFRPRLKCIAAEITTPAVIVPILCPICLKTEFEIVNWNNASLYCHRCSRGFDWNEDFVDLTLSSGVRDLEYTLTTSTGTRLFENPIVSFVYERGWRQEFASSGFPGPDREFDAAMKFLAPVLGDSIVDLSCGSGLFTRRFLTSGMFKTVIAVDYSAAMLTQTRQYIGRMQERAQAELLAVRADVGRLPFQTGSLKAIFSGAAIHCWPNPAQALAEISRVLGPGGVFVFSTFTRVPKDLERLLNRPLLRPLRELARSNRTGFKFFDEQQLHDLTKLVGLKDFETIRNRQYIMVKVTKPPPPPPHSDQLNTTLLTEPHQLLTQQ